MGIALWGAAVGALLGFMVGEFSEFGFFLGGAIGGGMGAWLRTILRREIAEAVQSALLGDLPAPSAEMPTPPVPMPAPSVPPVRPRAATARVIATPPADPPPTTDESPAPARVVASAARARPIPLFMNLRLPARSSCFSPRHGTGFWAATRSSASASSSCSLVSFSWCASPRWPEYSRSRCGSRWSRRSASRCWPWA